MSVFWMRWEKNLCAVGGVVLALGGALPGAWALDKPTGAPLVLSSIETEQGVPLAVLSADGKTATCPTVRLHWNPVQATGGTDDSTSFTLDIAADKPGAAVFTAQLWNASLAAEIAWQVPWQGARWKILDTPETDGTGISAGLAVGMIATSARRPYPKDVVVIGTLNPDGSLGVVSKLAERLDAAAGAGMTKVIIPNSQRFDMNDAGDVVNMVRHATDLHLQCIPVDTIEEATEAAMNDPLPELPANAGTPKYKNDVGTYIDDFAQREQTELNSGLAFAPKEEDLSKYSPRVSAAWKSIYADKDAGEQAYRAGQVYAAYRLLARANGRMHGANALTQAAGDPGQFDVKTALAEADGLRQRLHELMTPPTIDHGDLESGLVVAEMSDWAYGLSASLEDAELVTKQAYSQRTDATQAEKDRAREAILFANEEGKYLINGADFYTGLLTHVDANPVPANDNGANLLPELIPAELAVAEVFANGIRSRASDLRDGLLFDPHLAAYIGVLRETEAAWNARQHKKEMLATATAAAPADAATKLNASATTNVGFDPENTYEPGHAALVPTDPAKKVSDTAACLIWVNNDCEVAMLTEKYLRLNGAIDTTTHEWHLKDRAKLDALVQEAEGEAREGIAFAEKANVDSSVLDMIYEKAAQFRTGGDDASALEALRNYWRCALLGDMCWQLAYHAPAPVIAVVPAKAGEKDKDKDKDVAKAGDKDQAGDKDKTKTATEAASGTNKEAAPAVAKDSGAKQQPPPRALPVSNVDVVDVSPPPAPADVEPPANDAAATGVPAAVAPPVKPDEGTPTESVAASPENAPRDAVPPRALPVTDDPSIPSPAPVPTPVPTPAPAPAPVVVPASVPAADNGDANIPVAPIARTQDYTGGDAASGTNATPVIGPVPPAQNQ